MPQVKEQFSPRLLILHNWRGDDEPRVADVTEDGMFAIHKALGPGPYLRKWTVTHVPTKTAITDQCLSREDAEKVITHLREMPWTWESSDVAVFRRNLQHAPRPVWFKMNDLVAGIV